MTLKEFLLTANADNAIALTEAQAYQETEYSLITADTMSSLLIKSGLYSYVMDAPPEKEIRRVTGDRINAGGRFSFDPSEQLGVDNLNLFNYLVGLESDPLTRTDEYKATQLAVLQASIDAEAKSIAYPFQDIVLADVTEARDTGGVPLELLDNVIDHIVKINTTKQPLKPIDIAVEQRFSKDGVDWTEWHEVGAFRNVYYTQRSYETNIPKSPAAYRELRVVSPLTLGVEVI
jgi:hypothetical protein